MSESHECPTCGDGFDTRQAIGAHYAAAHDDDGPMDKMLLNELRELAGELGRTPKAKEITEYGLASERTYSKRFGSWNDALREAGLSENVRRNIPTEELLDELRRLDDEFDEPVTANLLDEHGEFCLPTYADRFGSWVNALVEVGIDPEHRYIDESCDLLRDLIRVANDLGKTPNQVEYNKRGEYSVGSCQSHFGGWNDALKEAGLNPNQIVDISDSDLIDEIHHLKDEIGRVPSPNIMQSRGRYSDAVYYDRFGSWPNALEEASLDPIGPLYGPKHPLWEGGKVGYGPNWAKQRRLARERDGNTCQMCGDGMDELGQYPDVHHITPVREFIIDGELDYESANDLDNLICLCRPCHRTAESMAPLVPVCD